MKRSRVNAILAEAEEMFARHSVALPPFAHWSPQEMAARAPGTRIAQARMGWDVTDYGQGEFDRLGLFLFTLRNGRLADLREGGGMAYAEKLLISRRDQLSPMHTHVVKAEDIICRGVDAPGARLAVQLHGSAPDGSFDPDAGGEALFDGVPRRFEAGEVVALAPGESVTLMPGDWHAFWGEGGDVLIGEVSTVNDDETDNVFPRTDRPFLRGGGGRGPAPSARERLRLPALGRSRPSSSPTGASGGWAGRLLLRNSARGRGAGTRRRPAGGSAGAGGCLRRGGLGPE